MPVVAMERHRHTSNQQILNFVALKFRADQKQVLLQILFHVMALRFVA